MVRRAKKAPAAPTPKPGWARPLPPEQRGQQVKRYRKSVSEERTADVVEADPDDHIDPYQEDVKDSMYWDGYSALPEDDDEPERVGGRSDPEARMAAHVVRSRGYGAGGDLSASAWALIRAAFLQECAYCGTRVANDEVVEHVVPVSQGGSTDAFNCVPACAFCNTRKRARDPLEWMGHNQAWLEQFFARVSAASERFARLAGGGKAP